MGIKSAADLAEVLVSVGGTELGCFAGTGDRGHPAWAHDPACTPGSAAGAQPEQIDALVETIADKIIRIDHAIAILEDWNGGDRGQ